jgi:hypothetical protein
VKTLAGPVSEAQGRNDGTELRPVAALNTIVAERSLLLQAARGDKQLARRTGPMPESPAGRRVWFAVVQASAVGANKDFPGIILVSVSNRAC